MIASGCVFESKSLMHFLIFDLMSKRGSLKDRISSLLSSRPTLCLMLWKRVTAIGSTMSSLNVSIETATGSKHNPKPYYSSFKMESPQLKTASSC